MSDNEFEKLGLSAEILRAVADKGYTTPSPIQKQAIPPILEGQDIMGGAQTGTGKTAGFTLPMLEILSREGKIKGLKPVRALILTPTRELAAQVSESVNHYGKYLTLKSTVIFGGVKIQPQIAKLRRGVDIIIATPGRLLDHVNQRNVDLSQVEMLILDEADRILDMGFIHDLKRIIKLLPRNRQSLLFSATFSKDIKKLADTLLNAPLLIEVAARNTSSEQVEQSILPVDRIRKTELLTHLIKENDWKQVLVFTRTKHGANRLCEKLEDAGIESAAIHGNKTQGARTLALSQFKKGKVRVLVATDIAARGLDINQLPHVVNFELPTSPEDYIHRIGRTGRAGNEGEALSLVCIDERKMLREIERLINRELPKVLVPGFEVNASIRAESVRGGGGGGARASNRRGPPSSNGRSSRGNSQSRGRGDSSDRGNRGRAQRGHPSDRRGSAQGRRSQGR